jgi:hypothetical protein
MILFSSKISLADSQPNPLPLFHFSLALLKPCNLFSAYEAVKALESKTLLENGCRVTTAQNNAVVVVQAQFQRRDSASFV